MANKLTNKFKLVNARKILDIFSSATDSVYCFNGRVTEWTINDSTPDATLSALVLAFIAISFAKIAWECCNIAFRWVSVKCSNGIIASWAIFIATANFKKKPNGPCAIRAIKLSAWNIVRRPSPKNPIAFKNVSEVTI